jgi:hypothetical protein
MLKEFIWRTFENTGSVDAYMLYREIEQSDKLQNESKVTQEEVAISY